MHSIKIKETSIVKWVFLFFYKCVYLYIEKRFVFNYILNSESDFKDI